MSFSLGYGPDGTAVEGVINITFPAPPLNYAADFRPVEVGMGKVVLTDITSPQDRPSTLRIAQVVRPNVYSGTSIDPAAFLANKRGTDTIVEVREVWAKTESTDPAYLRHLPVRCAITLTLPTDELITADAVQRLVARAVAGLYAQGDATHTDGVNALLHGVVDRD